MKKLNISLFLSLLAIITIGLSLSSCKDTLDMSMEEALKYNPKDDPFMEVCKHASEVLKTISADYYDKCSSIAELAEYLDEIKNLKYVEDAYCTNISMFVEVEDFGTTSFSFYPEIDIISSESAFRLNEDNSTRAATEISDSHTSLEIENAIIINQEYYDEKYAFCRSCSEETKYNLENIGIKAKIENAPSASFFTKELFDYDIVFLITHGNYDPKKQLHWILTGEVLETNEDRIYFKLKNIMKQNQISLDWHKEKRNGVDVDICYIKVSEKYISASNSRFKKEGSAIFIMDACQSLMGGEEYYTEDRNLRNYSFAKVFIDKGAGAYFGYDESNNLGPVSGPFLLSKLASGLSLQKAYETLPFEILHNRSNNGKKKDGVWITPITKAWTADFLSYYSNNNSQIPNSCLTRPVLTGKRENDLGNGIVIESKADNNFYCVDFLSQWVSASIPNIKSFMKDEFSQDNLRYGFMLSDSEDFKKLCYLSSMAIGDENCYLVDENNEVPSASIIKEREEDMIGLHNYLEVFNKVYFMQSIEYEELKSETKYYYRSYFFDGEEYYYSDIDSFTTPKFDSGNTEDPKDTGNTNNNAQTQDVPGTDL